ncbi:MAG: right-handed parallel beta-helix repeat-containing protein [Lachnospiraceae bacterium]|nr:right-handed parallel beta-helix repeat-containing protein [Lachnospiraceae bacterium]
MIQSVLTKFNQRKRFWMTPKHAFCTREKNFLVAYGAAMISQARENGECDVAENAELERLLYPGLGVTKEQARECIRMSKEKSDIMQKLSNEIREDADKVICMLDLMNVSYTENGWSESAWEEIDLWAKALGIYSDWRETIREFIRYAQSEQQDACAECIRKMQKWDSELTDRKLRFYWLPGDERVCTQDMLNKENDVYLTDRYEIREDLVLKKGMRLVIDHAEVRIYGNIAVEGGELRIESSKIIRKSNSHRAGVNIHDQGGRVLMRDSYVDCRNMGMFLRAENGSAVIVDSQINQTSRGAAVRFWGDQIQVKRCQFSECYSPENGGALMIRGGKGKVEKCSFRDCEASRGGAIYAVSGVSIVDCEFTHCLVADYGAAIFYDAPVFEHVQNCHYKDCHPMGVELVQHLYIGPDISKSGIRIKGEQTITQSTILDCPLEIDIDGKLTIENAILYINHPIYSRGTLHMKGVHMYCGTLDHGDMIKMDHGKSSLMENCEFDGKLQVGVVSATGTRLKINNSVFCNTQGGRAVYDAYAPEIKDSVFNFCQGGALYTQGGTIRHCTFVNCREKNGAGIRMYGSVKGCIEDCDFKRCVAESRGGAIDKGIGHQVIRCRYEGCSPENVH